MKQNRGFVFICSTSDILVQKKSAHQLALKSFHKLTFSPSAFIYWWVSATVWSLISMSPDKFIRFIDHVKTTEEWNTFIFFWERRTCVCESSQGSGCHAAKSFAVVFQTHCSSWLKQLWPVLKSLNCPFSILSARLRMSQSITRWTRVIFKAARLREKKPSFLEWNSWKSG